VFEVAVAKSERNYLIKHLVAKKNILWIIKGEKNSALNKIKHGKLKNIVCALKKIIWQPK